MTALDAIRARDAALIEENGYLFPPGEDYDSEPWRDRRALLAEVDRLADELDGMTDTALDMARKYRQWRPPGSQAQRESAIAAERARIAEAVRELPIAGLHPSEVKGAVLALLEP